MSAIGRRRILQVKVLVATIVVLASSQIPVGVGIDDYAPGNAVGWSTFEFMFSPSNPSGALKSVSEYKYGAIRRSFAADLSGYCLR
jgi:hypothetical protein